MLNYQTKYDLIGLLQLQFVYTIRVCVNKFQKHRSDVTYLVANWLQELNTMEPSNPKPGGGLLCMNGAVIWGVHNLIVRHN